MRLWYAPTSPFSRKVRIAAAELSLDGALALEEVNPWTSAALRAVNPLAKVPTLERDVGEPLYESAVIVAYLDALDPPARLHPPAGEARWRALLVQGLADGAMTAAGRLFADEQRPDGERSATMMARFHTAIDAALDDLARRPLDDEAPTIGEISAAAFVGYLDFRWPGHPWREGRPALAAWFDRFAARPSMRATAYRLPQ
ncbi:glutathione S-transferase family protein [Acuticoccus mangrovi]|uniref:Glutathione S-transferase n=1 Tax=Acuticoccus mangrovi TaxID=2796142 RepID=A0A934MG58_9HYPH|nr:glutathione S-transferase family protein [Acuticoccus mangrovi]MBJ3776203.1 glutathione S-transferase [Acuticoccus mangrovi]